MPDPLDEHARAKALAPRTLHLRRNHIQSAVTAASAAGVDVASWTSLASLVDPETVTRLLRQLWVENGHALTAYTHGIARTLIAIAAEWVKAPAETIAILKKLRGKLGTLPLGLTEKNKTCCESSRIRAYSTDSSGFRTRSGAGGAEIWRRQGGRSSICRMPSRLTFSSIYRCGWRILPP